MSSYVKTTYEYTKPRKTFGRQPLFKAVPAQMLDSIIPNKEDQKCYMLRNPVHREVQAVNPMSEHEMNTPLQQTRERGINHEEGGWPREVHPHNEDHTHRHRRRVTHDASYCEAIFKLTPPLEHFIHQNNAIDMYQTYFSEFQPQQPIETCSIRIGNVFRDEYSRPISCVKFTNESNPKLAVAYCYKTCMPDPQLNFAHTCYIWDVHKQTEPINMLKPEYPCWQLECSNVTPEVFICGLETGTVSLFDIRQGIHAVSSSLTYNSHRESVTALRVINSRTHTDFFSGSTDGQCLWWDFRNLSEPLDQLCMSVRIPASVKPNPSNAEGVICLDYDTGLPTKFLCGTTSGLVINTNRLGKTHTEKLVSHWSAHNGPVQSVQRSTCTLRMFITCGDYTVRVWSEEVRNEPIMVSKPYKNLVTDVCWAPLRYSCYMSICAGGYFYFWDLLRKYKDPLKILNVSEHALTRVTPYKNGEIVATGDVKGSLYLLQLSENMAIPGNRDKMRMHQIYERETRREHILDNRVKEIRLKARNEEEQAITNVPASIVDEDELNLAVEQEYFRTVNQELEKFDNISNQLTD